MYVHEPSILRSFSELTSDLKYDVAPQLQSQLFLKDHDSDLNVSTIVNLIVSGPS
jgi:hypothetical protein